MKRPLLAALISAIVLVLVGYTVGRAVPRSGPQTIPAASFVPVSVGVEPRRTRCALWRHNLIDRADPASTGVGMALAEAFSQLTPLSVGVITVRWSA